MKENESSEWEQSGCQNKGVRCEISHKGTGAFQFEASEQSKDWTSLRHFIESCLSVTIIGSLERLNSFNARICSSNSSSEQEEINECCQLQFEKKTCLFLCWGIQQLLWSFQEEMDSGTLISGLITQQVCSSCSFRDHGGRYSRSASVGTNSYDYFKQARELWH